MHTDTVLPNYHCEIFQSQQPHLESSRTRQFTAPSRPAMTYSTYKCARLVIYGIVKTFSSFTGRIFASPTSIKGILRQCITGIGLGAQFGPEYYSSLFTGIYIPWGHCQISPYMGKSKCFQMENLRPILYLVFMKGIVWCIAEPWTTSIPSP